MAAQGATGLLRHARSRVERIARIVLASECAEQCGMESMQLSECKSEARDKLDKGSAHVVWLGLVVGAEVPM